MTSGEFQAIFAGVTLFILWSSTVAGAAMWLMKVMGAMEHRILKDFDTKHKANAMTVTALSELVIRHDTMLNAEFGAPMQNGRQRHLRS